MGVPRAMAQVLLGRGIGGLAEARTFLNPRLGDLSDPFLLPDMREAMHATWSAIDKKQRIVVFGDYDADGITATALVVSVLRALGAESLPFLPNRLKDGYGLTQSAFDRCMQTCVPGLVITVDCGTNSEELIKGARAQGIGTVVTDHHEPGSLARSALAIVNPKRSAHVPTQMLAGVGVAFKLCHALVKQGMLDGRSICSRIDLREWLDLVALGTVADVVPLTHENRILVRHGLDRLNRTGRQGVQALVDVAGVTGRVHSDHVAFMMAPRINAAGRLGDAMQALELLLSDDADSARRHAEGLNQLNATRKSVEQDVYREAEATVGRTAKLDTDLGIVLGGEQWHEGTLGLVASRMCAAYHRPIVVVSFDEQGRGKGSCRSVPMVDILELLAECEPYLIQFGGHRAAAGLTLERAQFEGFRQCFLRACASRLSNTDLRPVETIDARIRAEDADQGLWAAIQKLMPFGVDNQRPIWAVDGVRVLGQPRRVGKNGEHLQMLLDTGTRQVESVAFGMGGREVPSREIEVAFALEEDTFRGNGRLRWNIRDFRVSGEA